MMKIKKLLKAKKAISPIFATLLIVVIAVTAVLLTYAWITPNAGILNHQKSVTLYEANVEFKPNGVITIEIGNSGSGDTQILQAYIGSSAVSVQNQATDPQTPLTLNSGAIVSFNVPYHWVAGNSYYFKVVIADGQALAFQEQAPQ
jgi:flagellin-like protein